MTHSLGMWKLITTLEDNNNSCHREEESSEGLRVGRCRDVTCFCEVQLRVMTHTGVVLPNPIPCPDAESIPYLTHSDTHDIVTHQHHMHASGAFDTNGACHCF